MAELERIGDFFVCQNDQKSPIALRRVSEEVVCLGFDPKRNQLVEIHVISDSEQMKGNGKLSFLERGWTAATLQSHCFPEILKVADDDGLYYYATEVNEGEFLTDYIVRNGPVPPMTAVAMGLDLADSLVEVEPHFRLLLGLRLKNLMVALENSAYLTLRIIDVGLGRPEPRGMNDFEMSEVLADLSRQIFYLLTGRPYAAGQSEIIDRIEGIDDSVAEMLKRTIEADSQSIGSFEEYRDILETAYRKSSSNLPRRSALSVSPESRPRLTAQREVFERSGYKTELEASGFVFTTDSKSFEYPYSATVSKKDSAERVRISWIPTEDVIPVSIPKAEAGETGKLRFLRHENVRGGVSLLEFLVLRNHRPSMVDSILLLNALSETITANPGVFSHHQIWFHFDEGGEKLKSARQGVDQWSGLSVEILPAENTAVFLNPPSIESDLSPLQKTQLSFLSAARELLCESPDEVHDFMDEAEIAIKSDSPYPGCAEILVALADKLDSVG